MSLYDSLDADILRSYHEYLLGSVIFYAMKENFCSEQSSRMTAMDNASKNAGTYQKQMNLIKAYLDQALQHLLLTINKF